MNIMYVFIKIIHYELEVLYCHFAFFIINYAEIVIGLTELSAIQEVHPLVEHLVPNLTTELAHKRKF